MNENIEKLNLNIEIDALCELYAEKKFFNVIKKTGILLKKYNSS